MHARVVTPALALDPEYWRALCPALHVGDDAFMASVKPMVVRGEIAQDARARLTKLGFTKIPGHRLNWRKAADHGKLARAVLTLLQHGWNPSWVLVYDEAWAIVQELSSFMYEATGNRINHDALVWHVSPHDENPTAFSPHRDRQPEDAPSTFREDGSSMYTTAWVPLTDATTENSCLCFIPRNQDPGYYAGDDDDPDAPPEKTDPLRLALPHKNAYQHITSVPAECGSVVVFTHRVIHWGSAPPPVEPASYRNSETENDAASSPRICVSFGFADAEYEPPYLTSSSNVGTGDVFPSLQKRVALVAAQMVSYHERFACDGKTLRLFHKLFTHDADSLDSSYKRKVLVEYVRAASSSSGGASDNGGRATTSRVTKKGDAKSTRAKHGDDACDAKKGTTATSEDDGDDDDGDDDDDDDDDENSASEADASEENASDSDAMDAALETMLDAEIAGDGEDFEDDFDTLAREDGEYAETAQEEEAVKGRGAKRRR